MMEEQLMGKKMIKSFNGKLIELLKKDLRFVDKESGELIKSEIIHEALKIDKKLIEVLLSEKDIKEKFFTEIKGHWVFELNKFIDFIQDKNFLSDSYTKFKNKIGLNIDGKFLNERKEVSLVWPFKDCVLEGGMTEEDQKRNEIFFNEILAQDEIDRLLDPKVLTNFKRITAKGEEKVTDFKRDNDGTIRENLIIKGNNLLALHSLRKEFQEKIKLIYIDPPYNTGSDSFNYNDNFNHSAWLTFMKNRLDCAFSLLKEDGIIFVHIDGREQAYLKVLMDDIFSRENFLSDITLKAKAGGGVGQESFLFDVCEYILVYAKNKNLAKNNIPFVETNLEDNVTKVYNNVLKSFGKDKHIKDINGGNVGKIKVFEHEGFEVFKLSENQRTQENYYKYFQEIFRTTNPQGGLMQRVMPQISSKGLISIEYIPTKGRSAGEKYRYFFLNSSLIVWLKDSSIKNDEDKAVYKLIKNDNLWIENLHQGIAKEGNVELKAGKKPEKLMKKIIEMVTEPGDIVLDYHTGSGTTCAVAHKLNRQYIGIEQLDYGKNDSLTRLKNIINGDTSGISKEINWKGGGDFVYCELMKFNEEAINKIESAKTTDDLLKIWDEMVEHYFLNYDVDTKRFNDNQEEFKKLPLEKQMKLLVEMLNKNQLYVNLSEIDDAQFKVSNEDKELNKKFYK